MLSRELRCFLRSAALTAFTFVVIGRTDWLWSELNEPHTSEPMAVLANWVVQVFFFILMQTTTSAWLYAKRWPLSPAEKKVNKWLIGVAVFNLFITIPLARAICLIFGAHINSERRFTLCVPARGILAEMLHHTMHSAFHVKGWFGWTLHQQHHKKDYSLPLSALSNHPIDLFVTVFGVVSCINLFSNDSHLDQLAVLFFIAHIGTRVHADSHFFWFLDIHGLHHADGRCNLNGYFPISDLVVGTFKPPRPYDKPFGWR